MTISNRGIGPDFPVLDAPRHEEKNALGRAIVDCFGFVEAYVGELDSWVSMPVRLVYDQAAGWHLECGPYDFDRCDIECLRAAIASYDNATRH
ncbi:hypothetical protein BST11_22795 [Mycobacterium alsense]|uniref:Uncharacterized protein n=1 Tax=Mycobacterium alsense TaxID=324058 RepID=A0AA42C1D1_9MYCO|nr:hypothetical protein [Mycobacterium alsense]MCV7381653.1 hypothetical protein [Mycobacterium alsense]OQZ88399.1 hypothetical protein BST11_22795 [Mycobacterium alsense]